MYIISSLRYQPLKLRSTFHYCVDITRHIKSCFHHSRKNVLCSMELLTRTVILFCHPLFQQSVYPVVLHFTLKSFKVAMELFIVSVQHMLGCINLSFSQLVKLFCYLAEYLSLSLTTLHLPFTATVIR